MTWTLRNTVEASTYSTGGDGLEAALSRDGSTLAIADWSANGGTGALYIYRGEPAGFTLDTTLYGPSSGLAWGRAWGVPTYPARALAISDDGTEIVVGAYSYSTSTGEAFVYSGTSWGTTTTLRASDGAASNLFGTSVAISGDGTTVVVGALGYNSYVGKAYAYYGASWGTEKKLVPSGSPSYYGQAVDVSSDGTEIVVGAPRTTYGGYATQGVVHVFSGASWATDTVLVSSEEPYTTGAYYFGSNVVISPDGTIIAVGAWGNTAVRGVVFVFSGANWGTEQAKLTATYDGTAGYYGWSLAISLDNSLIVVGGTQITDGGVYVQSGTNWGTAARIVPTNLGAAPWGNYAETVGITNDGRWVMAGASDHATYSRAYMWSSLPITVVGKASNNGTGGASVTMDVPAGVVDEDVMLMSITARGGTNTTITTPAGWDLLNAVTSTTVLKQAIYWRVASSEPASYAVTLTSSLASGCIMVVKEGDTVLPDAAQYAGQANASSATVTAPALGSWDSDEGVDIGLLGIAYGASFSPPGLYYEPSGADSASTGTTLASTSAGSYRGLEAVTTVGAISATAANAAVNIGHHVFIKKKKPHPISVYFLGNSM